MLTKLLYTVLVFVAATIGVYLLGGILVAFTAGVPVVASVGSFLQATCALWGFLCAVVYFVRG